jgi:hypothetical protein
VPFLYEEASANEHDQVHTDNNTHSTSSRLPKVCHQTRQCHTPVLHAHILSAHTTSHQIARTRRRWSHVWQLGIGRAHDSFAHMRRIGHQEVVEHARSAVAATRRHTSHTTHKFAHRSRTHLCPPQYNANAPHVSLSDAAPPFFSIGLPTNRPLRDTYARGTSALRQA